MPLCTHVLHHNHTHRHSQTHTCAHTHTYAHTRTRTGRKLPKTDRKKQPGYRIPSNSGSHRLLSCREAERVWKGPRGGPSSRESPQVWPPGRGGSEVQGLLKNLPSPCHCRQKAPGPPNTECPGPSDTSKPQAGSEGEGLWLRPPGHSASPLGSRGDLTTCRNALCSPKRNLCRAGKMQGGAVCGVKTREDSMLKSCEGFGNCLPDVLNQQNSKLQKTKRAHA